MQKQNKTQKGQKAEKLVENFLIKKKFSIIDKNVNFHNYGEIDIIAKENSSLVFVEVRSLQFNSGINPLETIGKNKQNKLLKAIAMYLESDDIKNAKFDFEEVRIDVASVIFKKSNIPIITYVKNAIFADDFDSWF